MTTGGESLALGVTSKSAHPDVAAAYIDFMTDAKAARVLAETGNLPAVPTADAQSTAKLASTPSSPRGSSSTRTTAWCPPRLLDADLLRRP